MKQEVGDIFYNINRGAWIYIGNAEDGNKVYEKIKMGKVDDSGWSLNQMWRGDFEKVIDTHGGWEYISRMTRIRRILVKDLL